MKNILKLFLSACLIAALSAGGVYAGSGGEATAQVLEMGAGAVLPAMGGAGQGSVRGAAALSYNPAGFADVGNELEFTYQKIVEDINYGNFDYVQKYNNNLNWAAGLRYISYGSEDETVWSAGTGSDLDKAGSFSGSDIVLTGGVAGRIDRDISWGAAARLIRLEIDDEDAVGVSFDAGMQWKSSDESLPVMAGIVLQNAGPKLKFDKKKEDLPLLAKAGGSLFLDQLVGHDITLHMDVEYQVPDSETFLRTGGEWRFYEKMVALRLGYDGSLDVDDGLTYGLGIYVPDSNMSFDYALVPYGDFGTVHRMAFNYRL